MKLVDVAGLVSGASAGRGRGNQFLDELRQADALIHVVDASGGTDEEGRKVEVGSNDPVQDVLMVENELDLWILGIIEQGLGEVRPPGRADGLQHSRAPRTEAVRAWHRRRERSRGRSSTCS